MADVSWCLSPMLALDAVVMLSADLTYELIGIGVTAGVMVKGN